MNSVQMHLALTHVPVILSIVGLIMLTSAFFIKNTTLTKTSYVLVLIAGIAAIPVYFTGGSAEEAIEHLPGVSESVIERHEEVARLAMIAITVAGLVALAALFSNRWPSSFQWFKVLVLLVSITSGGLMAQAAHLGGQIRHTEIRNGIILQNDHEQDGPNANTGKAKMDKDDD